MNPETPNDDKFRPIASNELVKKTSVYEFHIPSFQRGYRWKKSQVEDMLDDLFDFVSSDNPYPAYYLQPLVVRNLKTKTGKDNSWEVLDGQQRLTTLLLIMQEFINKGFLNQNLLDYIGLYSLIYDEREEVSFSNPDSDRNMDAFYVANAKKVISEWFERKKSLGDTKVADQLEIMAKILFGFNSLVPKEVKFIWYEIDDSNSANIQKESIAVFNRLNNGKLKLTPSELIKALFILAEPDERKRTIFSMEWNQMEKMMEDDEFFATLARRDHNPDTRMDLLFNFSSGKDDSEACYRYYQDLYNHDPIKFFKTWEKIKRDYDQLMSWYNIPNIRNLIGYLCYSGKSSIWKIKEEIEKKKAQMKDLSWCHSDTLNVIKSLIKSGLKDIKPKGSKELISFPEAVNYINYEDNKDLIPLVLLLFNVLTSNISGQPFKFNLLRGENWDIEHVDSQSENPLIENSDKKKWLDSTVDVLRNQETQLEENKNLTGDQDFPKEYQSMLESCGELLKTGIALQKEYDEVKNSRYNEWSKNFSNWYDEIIRHFGPPEEKKVKDQHEIGNLVLLDNHTNRSYGNALFIEKSNKIIDRDSNGKFLPIATKNVFLKYYSHKETYIGKNNDIVWTQEDASAYQEAIYQEIKKFMTE